jgi:hypothetical protein
MQLYKSKKLDFGFIILAPEHNLGHIKSTVRCIKIRYPNTSVICVTDKSANRKDLAEIKEICPVYRAKDTFSSLVNKGMKETKNFWNIFVCAGATVGYEVYDRLSFFVSGENEVLFSVISKNHTFETCSLNGMFINKNVWQKIGPWENEGNINEIKSFWCAYGLEKGIKFKGILGIKIC